MLAKVLAPQVSMVQGALSPNTKTIALSEPPSRKEKLCGSKSLLLLNQPVTVPQSSGAVNELFELYDAEALWSMKAQTGGTPGCESFAGADALGRGVSVPADIEPPHFALLYWSSAC